jgi:hypothetical protein
MFVFSVQINHLNCVNRNGIQGSGRGGEAKVVELTYIPSTFVSGANFNDICIVKLKEKVHLLSWFMSPFSFLDKGSTTKPIGTKL